MYEEIKKAANIAKKVRIFSEKLLKPEESLLNIAEQIEQKIIDLGGLPAFPVNISINNIAAHYTPTFDDKSILKEGDVVKVDFGVQFDGYIIDTAYTVEINDNKYENLIKASKEALENVRKNIRRDMTLGKIGSIIENTIKSYGYNPIYNLSGHRIDRYILHAGENVPNYDNGSDIKLSRGLYAIEPFATNGSGYVKDGEPSTIYIFINIKPIRDPSIRKFMEELFNKYKTLPFCYRWLYKEYGNKVNVKFAVEYLKKNKIIYEYPVLLENPGYVVTQFETTFFVNDGVEDLMSE